jgi:hypothetical protein
MLSPEQIRGNLGGRSEARARPNVGGLRPGSVPCYLDAENGINAAKSGSPGRTSHDLNVTSETEGSPQPISALQPAEGAVQIELLLRQNGQSGMIATPLRLRNLRP